MSSARLPKIVYLEALVSILKLSELPIHIAINNILQYSQESHLPLYFTKKVTGAPSNTKLKTISTDVINEELLITEVKVKRETFDENEKKSIHSVNINLDDSPTTLIISLIEFTYKKENFINILDGTTIHEPLPLCLEDIFCERDDVIAFMETEENTPSYLDESSPYYAEELDLAIQLHKAIHINKNYDTLSNTRNKVDKWLRKNRPEIESEALTKRLSSIISIKRNKTP